MNANHPDIKEFVQAKRNNDHFENFNISVATEEDFWEALEKDEAFELVNPRNGKVRMEVDPDSLLDIIAHSAWESADPGIVFFDNANKYNPMIPAKGRLQGTNPCSEQMLYPYGSCNLGSINLEYFVNDGEFDWDDYRATIPDATRFLDNVIDMNKFPLEKIREQTKDTRRIGLGVMGLANALYRMGVAYDSKKGYNTMERMAEILSYTSMKTSVKLASKRGSMRIFEETDYTEGEIPVAGYHEDGGNERWEELITSIKTIGIRNSKTTTLPPTGSTAMIADTSHGMEPEFSLAYEKNVDAGDFYYANDAFEDSLRSRDIYDKELLKRVANNYGTIQDLDRLPQKLKDVYKTALDIHYLDHLLAQASWQKWISASISKTINMPVGVGPDDIKRAFQVGHELGLKGLAVYREDSKSKQVINMEGERSEELLVEPSNHAKRVIGSE